ncbi:MAG: FeoB-associated Cys-rich membrane protein [Eubacteriales bacterium]|nr:FeoB-associated Cys-rich membrane protein [Eubacteriales bacterium]
MANVIIIVILIILIGSACYYIWKNKKKGIKCIGCPYANSCGGGCGGNSSIEKKD